ncbi:hypothetical protein ACHAW5_007907, partial [Stephanodiscus triporus]
MNLLFCAAPKDVYAFLTTEAYPDAFAPFPAIVTEVPDFSQCADDNARAAVKATHARDKKTRADIVTMNAALCDVFLDAMSPQVRATVLQRRLSEPNIIFVDLFLWFVNNYGKTTAEDREDNRHRMAADWHPADGFDSLIHRLFTGAGYASSAGYPMNDGDVIDIGLRVIKRCGMYSEEYKQWIAREAISPKVIETFDSFKKFWADKIALVNQTAIPASLHGYGMAAVNDDDATINSYSESIANFGVAYAATQESVRTQGTTIAALQSQLGAMQQYCMAVQQQQQPPNTVYARNQNPNNRRGGRRNNNNPNSGGGNNGYQAPGGDRRPAMPATPYKRFENWNYCHTHGGDVDDNHTSQTCSRPGPAHNWQANRQNVMAGSSAGMHKTILPHFLTTDAPASNVQPTLKPIIVRLPNGDRVHSTHTCTLDIPNLPHGACAAHIIPGLATHSLLSVVNMCNAGCEVNFTKIGCTVKYRGRTIVCGRKCTKTGLWMLPLATNLLETSAFTSTSPSSNPTTAPSAPTTQMATNIDATSSSAEYAQYIHQVLCSPPATTLLHALSKSTELSTIPGLTQALVRTHLPRSTATDKGHMRRHRANMASTRNMQDDILTARAEVDRMFPQQEVCAMHDMFCFAALADANTGTMYTDLTGAFPVRSFKNMQYIFVAYIYDLNAIIVRAMPS